MIKHNHVYIDPEVSAAVNAAILEGRLSFEEDVQKFESAFEDRFNLEPNSCIAVSSGSVALFLLLKCLKAKSNNLEIPRYTCASLTRAAQMADYNVIHTDSISNSLPQFAYSPTQADLVVLPHMCGIESTVKPLDNNLICIEDATQVLGSKNSQTFSGFTSGLSIISFYATKSLTTLGQGGMIYSRDTDIFNSIRSIISSDSSFHRMGINLRMPGLNAIAGTIALDLIDRSISLRENVYNEYINCGLNLISFPDFQVNPSYYRSLLFAPGRSLELTARLKTMGISAICPYEHYELCDADDAMDVSNTHSLVNGLVSLPAHKGVGVDEISYISKSVNDIIGDLEWQG